MKERHRPGPGELDFCVEPGGSLRGKVRVPGDKSISHRAIILGALADGRSTVRGFLEGDDCLATIEAFRAMGVGIHGPRDGVVEIDGVGMDGLREPAAALDLGNSGTSMRLLCGLLAAQEFDVVLSGDSSLRSRPMGRVVEPLTRMGAIISSGDSGTAPLRIRGARLQGIHYPMPMASAQVKSCLLLAGLYARGMTCVHEPARSRDHTERMLAAAGYPVQHRDREICVRGGGRLQAMTIDVPADISSAAFFLVGACIAPGSDLLLQHVGVNPTRSGVISILQAMGADIEIRGRRTVGGEEVADLRVRSASLQGIDIDPAQVPLAIDEFPAIFVAAACARGRTRLHGASELRVKESDRIQAMADGLSTLGVEAQPLEDGIVIEGGPIHGGVVESRGDHRIAMALTMAGLRSTAAIRVRDCAAVDTSFPGFAELVAATGLALTTE